MYPSSFKPEHISPYLFPFGNLHPGLPNLWEDRTPEPSSSIPEALKHKDKRSPPMKNSVEIKNLKIDLLKKLHSYYTFLNKAFILFQTTETKVDSNLNLLNTFVHVQNSLNVLKQNPVREHKEYKDLKNLRKKFFLNDRIQMLVEQSIIYNNILFDEYKLKLENSDLLKQTNKELCAAYKALVNKQNPKKTTPIPTYRKVLRAGTQILLQTNAPITKLKIIASRIVAHCPASSSQSMFHEIGERGEAPKFPVISFPRLRCHDFYLEEREMWTIENDSVDIHRRYISRFQIAEQPATYAPVLKETFESQIIPDPLGIKKDGSDSLVILDRHRLVAYPSKESSCRYMPCDICTTYDVFQNLAVVADYKMEQLNGNIKFINLNDFNQHSIPMAHQYPITLLSIFQRHAYTVSQEGLKVWDIQTAKFVGKFKTFSDEIKAFTHDQSSVWISDEKILYNWDLRAPVQEIQRFPVPNVCTMANNGPDIVLGTTDGKVVLLHQEKVSQTA